MSKESTLWNISFFVIALHLILFGWMVYSTKQYPIRKKNRPLVVKTISLQSTESVKSPKQEAFSKSEITKKTNPIKKELPKPKNEPKKIEPKAESKAKTVVEAKKTELKSKPVPVNTKMQSLLAQAQATMEKVERNPKQTTATALPVPQIAHSKEKLSFKEVSYHEELATLLKLVLRFPEYGQVTIDLTLDRTGKVKKIHILHSESQLNQNYIEKTIKTISFPPLGNNFLGASDYTFRIQLDNEP